MAQPRFGARQFNSFFFKSERDTGTKNRSVSHVFDEIQKDLETPPQFYHHKAVILVTFLCADRWYSLTTRSEF